MSTKHTPGPWSVSEQFGSVGAIRHVGGFIAFPACNPREISDERKVGESWLEMRDRTEPLRKELAAEVKANARLISAAPELLEALQDLTLNVDEAMKTGGWVPTPLHASFWESMADALGAINKATGSEQ